MDNSRTRSKDLEKPRPDQAAEPMGPGGIFLMV